MRLSDELAYIAAKNLTNKQLHRNYPYDFDGNSCLRAIALRIPEDPAPLVRAHGLPLLLINKDCVPLIGRVSVLYAAALKDKSNSVLKEASSAFTAGSIIASNDFVRLPRTIDRQISLR